MSRKLNFVPTIENYAQLRRMMSEDLAYRLQSRAKSTVFGRPLYLRINVQIIMTQECPYSCPFCIERKHPMEGRDNFSAQIASLRHVLNAHPDARLTITGGEPGLYPYHVSDLVRTYLDLSNQVFVSINTAGYNPELCNIPVHINLSYNDYVKPNAAVFPGCTLQTVLPEEKMRIDFLREFMSAHPEAASFSFRYLSGMDKHDYSVRIWNELQNAEDFQVGTFRVGDFFVYCTFRWKGRHGRVTLGDMYQQSVVNQYKDGYSNIIIHPDGRIGVNWN